MRHRAGHPQKRIIFIPIVKIDPPTGAPQIHLCSESQKSTITLLQYRHLQAANQSIPPIFKNESPGDKTAGNNKFKCLYPLMNLESPHFEKITQLPKYRPRKKAEELLPPGKKKRQKELPDGDEAQLIAESSGSFEHLTPEQKTEAVGYIRKRLEAEEDTRENPDKKRIGNA